MEDWIFSTFFGDGLVPSRETWTQVLEYLDAEGALGGREHKPGLLESVEDHSQGS
jgi:hypothetical protein